jgi:hypothetical protein
LLVARLLSLVVPRQFVQIDEVGLGDHERPLHITVNRMVAGSKPARGANQINILARFCFSLWTARVGIVRANRLPPVIPETWSLMREYIARLQ